jgi:hypothetical protein
MKMKMAELEDERYLYENFSELSIPTFRYHWDLTAKNEKRKAKDFLKMKARGWKCR